MAVTVVNEARLLQQWRRLATELVSVFADVHVSLDALEPSADAALSAHPSEHATLALAAARVYTIAVALGASCRAGWLDVARLRGVLSLVDAAMVSAKEVAQRLHADALFADAAAKLPPPSLSGPRCQLCGLCAGPTPLVSWYNDAALHVHAHCGNVWTQRIGELRVERVLQ